MIKGHLKRVGSAGMPVMRLAYAILGIGYGWTATSFRRRTAATRGSEMTLVSSTSEGRI